MEFRLIYRGSLPSQNKSSNRTRDKHAVRKQFHVQLRELFRQHPQLRHWSEYKYRVEVDEHGQRSRNTSPDDGEVKSHLEHVADEYQRCGGRFLPFIRKGNFLTCSLNILFLRRDNPGHVIETGGDIDNRIKVLLDGLKIPATVADLGGFAIDSDESPFYCLLEDDSLITGVSITTDRLLVPMEGAERLHDVNLVVHVTAQNPYALFGSWTEL